MQAIDSFGSNCDRRRSNRSRSALNFAHRPGADVLTEARIAVIRCRSQPERDSERFRTVGTTPDEIT